MPEENNVVETNSVKLFTVVDEKNAQIKPLEGTYEVHYKYSDNPEAVRVLEGDVKRGQGMSPTGVTQFPVAEKGKELEFSEIKVTPKEGWDAYAAGSKVDQRRIPETAKEAVMLESLIRRKATKREMIESIDSDARIKQTYLQEKYGGEIPAPKLRVWPEDQKPVEEIEHILPNGQYLGVIRFDENIFKIEAKVGQDQNGIAELIIPVPDSKNEETNISGLFPGESFLISYNNKKDNFELSDEKKNKIIAGAVWEDNRQLNYTDLPGIYMEKEITFNLSIDFQGAQGEMIDRVEMPSGSKDSSLLAQQSAIAQAGAILNIKKTN